MATGIKKEGRKTKLTINLGGGVQEIDLTPVEKIKSMLEEAVRGEENRRKGKINSIYMDILERVENLNREQLNHLALYLVGLVNTWSGIYQHLVDNPDMLLQYKKLLDSCEPLQKISSPEYVKRIRGVEES